MAGARRGLLLLFLFFQVVAFGASVPLEPAPGEGGGGGGEGAEEEEKAKEDPAKAGPVPVSHDIASTPIKPSESRKLSSGETPPDSLPKTDKTEAKESQKSTKPKNVEQSGPNSHVQNPELSRHQETGILQEEVKPPQADSHLSGIAHENSDLKKLEPLPPASDSNQIHTSELDSAVQKSGLHDAEPGEDLSLKHESLPDEPVPNSLPKQSDPEEVKETPKTLPPDSPAADSSSKNTDPKEGKETSKDLLHDEPVPNSLPKKTDPKGVKETPKKLQPDTPVVDSGSKKTDPKEGKETSKDLLHDGPVPNSLPKIPDPKEGKEDQNEANQNGILTTKLKPTQPNENVPSLKTSVQNGKLPTTVENNPSDTPVSKDEDDEDEGLEEDELIGKVGEEISGPSQSEKEEAKSSPAGPTPKNGSENSHFFAYLVTTAIVVAALYIAYHNKRKIIAFALEGKKSKVIRRPKSSDYQRLDQKI